MSHGDVSGAEAFKAAAWSHQEMCCDDCTASAFELEKPHEALLLGHFSTLNCFQTHCF